MSELSDRVAGYREGWNDAKAEATLRIKQLEAALRYVQADPATPYTLRQIIRNALDQSSPPVRQENDDVFKGFRGNNEA